MNRATHWLYRHSDGHTSIDVFSHQADSLDALLADAHRDALTMQCGRELVALVDVQAHPSTPEAAVPDPGAQQARVVAELGRSALPAPSAQPDSHAVAWHSEPLSTPWWSVSGPFGSGSQLALALLGCAQRHVDVDAAVSALAEGIAHQSSLYPVTPVALPFCVDLVLAQIPASNAVADVLVLVCDAVAEVGPEPPLQQWLAMRDHLPPLMQQELEQATLQHVAAAQDIQRLWPVLAKRLRTSADAHPQLVEALTGMQHFE